MSPYIYDIYICICMYIYIYMMCIICIIHHYIISLATSAPKRGRGRAEKAFPFPPRLDPAGRQALDGWPLLQLILEVFRV